MDNGQGGDAPGTIDDLADFLVDTPNADSDPDQEESGQPSDEPQEDNSEEQTEDAPADEEESSEDAEKPTSGLKFKVPVKADDGSDTTIEVDEKELVAGYQRHAQFTKLTMELADKEREITQVVHQKLDEGRNHYMQQAQLARAAVLQLAGLRSPQEMAQLAASDPATWVQEQSRQSAVQSVLAQLEQGMQREQQQTAAQREAATKQEISRAWGVLGQQGIDKPKLAKIYDTVSTKYNVPAERLAQVTDPALVLIMRDAAAYQGLKDKKAAVVQRAQDAPKLPTQRQSVPKQEQQNKALSQKFSTGKAKIKDLAAWIANN